MSMPVIKAALRDRVDGAAPVTMDEVLHRSAGPTGGSRLLYWVGPLIAAAAVVGLVLTIGTSFRVDDQQRIDSGLASQPATVTPGTTRTAAVPTPVRLTLLEPRIASLDEFSIPYLNSYPQYFAHASDTADLETYANEFLRAQFPEVSGLRLVEVVDERDATNSFPARTALVRWTDDKKASGLLLARFVDGGWHLQEMTSDAIWWRTHQTSIGARGQVTASVPGRIAIRPAIPFGEFATRGRADRDPNEVLGGAAIPLPAVNRPLHFTFELDAQDARLFAYDEAGDLIGLGTVSPQQWLTAPQWVLEMDDSTEPVAQRILRRSVASVADWYTLDGYGSRDAHRALSNAGLQLDPIDEAPELPTSRRIGFALIDPDASDSNRVRSALEDAGVSVFDWQWPWPQQSQPASPADISGVDTFLVEGRAPRSAGCSSLGVSAREREEGVVDIVADTARAAADAAININGTFGQGTHVEFRRGSDLIAIGYAFLDRPFTFAWVVELEPVGDSWRATHYSILGC